MTGIVGGIGFTGGYSARLLLVAVLVLAGAPLAHAAWENYQRDTLAAAIARFAEISNESEETTRDNSYALFPGESLRVDVVFTGRTRALSEDRRLTIEYWAKSFGVNLAAIRNFENDIEVREGGKTYWLPIQNILIPPLHDEVGKGGRATLFLVLIGRKGRDYVFIVNEFNAL